MAKMGLEDLVVKLYEVGGVKFGTFTLKSGIQSPVYFDLRVIVSYPELMVEVSEYLWEAAFKTGAQFASVCGVPYTALPLATCMATAHNVPMLIRRKEAKSYGTKKLIEGHFDKGDQCLVVEDVVTSGSSVKETVEALEGVGLVVKDAVVLLDRGQGGCARLKADGINLHSVITMATVLRVLQQRGKLDQAMVTQVEAFITENNTFGPVPGNKGDGKLDKTKEGQTYAERAKLCGHPLTKQLFTIMDQKKSNLCLAADVTSAKQLLQLAESVGPYICVLKTHIDIVEDFTSDLAQKLTEIATRQNFLIFEDRKYADIGNTVRLQYGSGIHRVADWAHITNAHTLPGPGIVDGLKKVGGPKGRGCLLIAQMSSMGNLLNEEYTTETVKLAEKHDDFVMGFICQSKLTTSGKFIHMTPGVKLQEGTDNLGQQYLTPQDVICKNGCDIIIVGRGIVEASDPLDAARQYRDAGYSAYLSLVKSS